MAEHILFLTGKLAEKSLHRVLAEIQATEFTYEVRQMGLSVAALMTADLIRRRLDDVGKANRIVLPGRCRGDIEALSRHFGVPFERGPEELKDLPGYFGKEQRQRDLTLYDVTIFAEIVDAPHLNIEAIIDRASQYAKDGADVIDVGCLPDTPFPHLDETIQALKQAGFRVSLDSTKDEELLRGGKAGADYLLSLNEETLWIANEVAATPVLISAVPTEIETLYRNMEAMEKKGRAYYADPILEPIHFGFTDSLLRYHGVRARFPEAPMMMGVGNLTELTHADTAGINALLMGIISELRITGVLTTEVSEHCRSAVREADRARRILYAAREDGMPPQHIDPGLMALHERKPFPYEPDEIREMAEAIKDKNFRIQVSRTGIHICNSEGLHTAQDPYDLFPYLDVEEDGAHAFYLGLELARAQIAWQLGKRYRQDEELGWGCMVEKAEQDLSRFAPERSTLKARRRFRHRSSGK
ncbi:MAG: DUF6513 domain-containing protein [Gammaproteobacteria bacterium]